MYMKVTLIKKYYYVGAELFRHNRNAIKGKQQDSRLQNQKPPPERSFPLHLLSKKHPWIDSFMYGYCDLHIKKVNNKKLTPL